MDTVQKRVRFMGSFPIFVAHAPLQVTLRMKYLIFMQKNGNIDKIFWTKSMKLIKLRWYPANVSKILHKNKKTW